MWKRQLHDLDKERLKMVDEEGNSPPVACWDSRYPVSRTRSDSPLCEGHRVKVNQEILRWSAKHITYHTFKMMRNLLYEINLILN